jgi:hypothetical protein
MKYEPKTRLQDMNDYGHFLNRGAWMTAAGYGRKFLEDLRHCEACLATALAEQDALLKELAMTRLASAIFEQNSAACADEFEGRLKAEKERDAAVKEVDRLKAEICQSCKEKLMSPEELKEMRRIQREVAESYWKGGREMSNGGEIEVGDVVKILARPVGWREPRTGFNDVQPIGAMCRVTGSIRDDEGRYIVLERLYAYDSSTLQLVVKACK